MPIQPDSGFYSVYADRAQRLAPIQEESLYPWYRAPELERCFLYWIPVVSFPVPSDQVAWQMEFFDRLVGRLRSASGLRPEVFLQFQAATEEKTAATLQKRAVEFHPLLGFSRRPGAPLPKFPGNEEVKRDQALYLRGEKSLDVKQIMAGYCYWFLNKADHQQREAFLGQGGLTMIFLKPDPKTAVPPLVHFSSYVRRTNPAFQVMDVDRFVAGVFALTDGFLARSKKLFGAGLEDEAVFPGIPFILPLLESADFFRQSDEECGKWFELFDVYMNESPNDMGLVLASKQDLDQDLLDILRQMRHEGLEYPDRPGRM